MKKICFVTAARSEYGPMKWIMQDVRAMQDVSFQLIVTGGHLLEKQGFTVKQIEDDGFHIDKKIHVDIDNTSKLSIAQSMGEIGTKFAAALDELDPDYLVVLGDRYELLPICSTAFIMEIPIIHFSGGDVTEGAIDNGVRNAITMLASYHFPSTQDSLNNIIRMTGSPENVWAIGEPGLDAFNRIKLLSREELAESLNLSAGSDWALLTYHPETRESVDHNVKTIRNCIDCLLKINNLQIIATYANLDLGGDQINQILLETANHYSQRFIAVSSLGQIRYLSTMKQVSFIIGNSSSGILEAPFLSIPVVNIGNRQQGRYQCANIIQSGSSKEEINKAIEEARCLKPDKNDLSYWGTGQTSKKFIEILQRNILKINCQ